MEVPLFRSVASPVLTGTTQLPSLTGKRSPARLGRSNGLREESAGASPSVRWRHAHSSAR